MLGLGYSATLAYTQLYLFDVAYVLCACAAGPLLLSGGCSAGADAREDRIKPSHRLVIWLSLLSVLVQRGYCIP